METLYRYRRTGVSLANTIEEIKGRLWCAAPAFLNDPFDGIGYVKPENVNIEFNTTGDPLMAGLPNPYLVPTTLSSFVACFSKNWNIPPMWAHYSQFNGVCLGYDFAKITECITKKQVLTLAQRGVGYQANLGKVDYKEEFTISNDNNSHFIKTTDWDYEDEWRIVVKVTKDDKKAGEIINTLDCLTEITIGHETDLQTTNTIIDTVKFLGRDIRIHKARVDSGKAGYFRDPVAI